MGPRFGVGPPFEDLAMVVHQQDASFWVAVVIITCVVMWVLSWLD